MPLMGSLYIGSSGLRTSQNALNTTAHNLSNLDTKGYTRQQVLQATREYNKLSLSLNGVSSQQVGLGTYYSKVRQVRDYFLDQTYRKESSKSAFYDTSATALEEVETLLGEMQGASFSTALDDLWVSVQSLANDPSTSVGKGLLVNKASAFLERAQAVYAGLSDYQDNLNLQVKNGVDQINYYGKQLKSLNDQIRKVEVNGVESANDLRDARNQILDELSKLAKTTYSEEIDGTVTVQLEGVDFVKRDIVYEIGLNQDEGTGYYTPFWVQNAKYTETADGKKIYDIDGAEVFDLSREISSAKNTDQGGVRALLLTRGDRSTNYTDLDESIYNNGVSNSVMMNVEAEFDALIHNITTKINEVIAGAADPATGYLCEEDADGNMVPLQLFQKLTTDGYDASKIGTAEAGADESLPYDENGYMREDPAKSETLYTIKNLRINPALLSEPTKLDLVKPDGELDYELGAALKEVFTANDYTLNPNVKTPCNLVDFYNDLVIQVGNTGMVYRSMEQTQEAELESIEYAREEVVGVSSDEELSNMIKFQNAYNASSRYINVIDEMLEHILTTLGA